MSNKISNRKLKMVMERVALKNAAVQGERLSNLFLLALHWSTNPDLLTTSYSTVDHIMLMFRGMEIISESQANALIRDTRFVHGLKYKMILAYPATRSGSVVLREAMESPNVWKVAILGSRHINLSASQCEVKLLHNTQIHCTHEGHRQASQMEERYADILRKDAFLAQEKAYEEMKPEYFGAVIRNYNKRVDNEVTAVY